MPTNESPPIRPDAAAQVRPGEELDLASLNLFFGKKHPEIGQVESIRQFHGGYSNLTYQLDTTTGSFVLRRPPVGANIKTAHDMGREFRLLTMVRTAYPKVPRPLLFCDDAAVLGCDFYLMEKVNGVILKPNPRMAGTVEEGLAKKIAHSVIGELATLHQLDLEKTGLASIGKPEGYVERQVSGWSKRYRKAETDKVPAMEFLLDWLPANLPQGARPGFIHNDFKLDNLILHPERLDEVIAVLDWEMATVGDTLMDLGLALCYWVEPTDHPLIQQFNPYVAFAKNISRREASELYFQRTGSQPVDLLFYYAFGCFKLAVVLQQIYARYVQGLNKNPMVANFLPVLTAFAENGQRAVQQGRISELS